ncbi:hypothetical protein OG444_18175 [Streptomyces sp. NBC_01232]|uniref:hypothetical protein n=1 Tax=unclassified Streptomyces TaxID=2593676 RepID=UPI002E149B50|nr:hypothetical protein OG444_18175 [Streptomyces sp. NBC_01232]
MEHEQTIPEQRNTGEAGADPHVPDAPESADSPDAPADAPAPRPRRGRGRTTILIAGAAVLGVLAGTVTGYAVQYHREPTPLAPLAQQDVKGPKPLAVNDTTTLRSINANRWHKADEDLVKKLVEVPGGAQNVFSGPQSPDEFSIDHFAKPSGGVGGIIADGVRRIASVHWSVDDRDFVEITLLQFRNRRGAEEFQAGVNSYMPTKKFAGNNGREVPGVPDDFGQLWIDSEADEKPGYHPLRHGTAIVRRGDIVMHLKFTNNRGKVDANAVAELAKRQMERL